EALGPSIIEDRVLAEEIAAVTHRHAIPIEGRLEDRDGTVKRSVGDEDWVIAEPVVHHLDFIEDLQWIGGGPPVFLEAHHGCLVGNLVPAPAAGLLEQRMVDGPDHVPPERLRDPVGVDIALAEPIPMMLALA